MPSLLLLLLLLAARAPACSFVAVAAREGRGLAGLDADAELHYRFLRDHARPPNDDGYGLLYYGLKPELSAGQVFHASGAGVWYGHGDGDGRVLDSALAALRDPARGAVLALGHARNGSGGTGSHPFTFDWGGRSYSFMHNGDLSSGTSADLKEGLLRGLSRSGWFALLPPSHWSNWKGDPRDVDSWVDSELLFHYLMRAVAEAGGDVSAGLTRALRERDFFGCDVAGDIRPARPGEGPASVINFVLSDGEALYAYRNSRPDDDAHLLSWRVHESGLAVVRTDECADARTLAPHELVVIPCRGHVAVTADVYAAAAAAGPRPRPDRQGRPAPRAGAGGGEPAPAATGDSPPPADLAWLPATPNPGNPRTILRLRLGAERELRVAVHDLRGRHVATLFDGRAPAGELALPWDGAADTGAPAASGVFVCVADDGRAPRTMKLLMLR